MSHKNTSASNKEEQEEKLLSTRISDFNSQLFTLTQSCWSEPASCSCPSSKSEQQALMGGDADNVSWSRRGAHPSSVPGPGQGHCPSSHSTLHGHWQGSSLALFPWLVWELETISCHGLCVAGSWQQPDPRNTPQSCAPASSGSSFTLTSALLLIRVLDALPLPRDFSTNLPKQSLLSLPL